PHMHPFECTKNAMDGGSADIAAIRKRRVNVCILG
ncbi:MAG: hypothetical protein ACI84R_002739, partial [Candidatus Azotimanducaceae bacterium]